MTDRNGLLLSRRGALESGLAVGLASAFPLRAAAATAAISAAVDVGKAAHPLSDYMYGGFI